jgi:hypothetical protein
MTAQCIGAMVVDVDGHVVHATGTARSSAVQRHLCDYLSSRAGFTGVVSLATPGGPHRVQFLRGVDSDIVLMFSADSPAHPTTFNPIEGEIR